MFINELLSPSKGDPSASNVQRVIHSPCPLFLWGTPQSLRNLLIRRLLVSSRNSHKLCPGLEVCTTHRACSGSVGCLHVSLGEKLSEISGADSAALSTSVQVRHRVRHSKSIVNSMRAQVWDMHTSSLLVLKRHCALCVRVRHTDSATGSICSISILLLRNSILDLCTVRCTSLGGPRPMANLRWCSGQMTSLTLSRQLFVRLSSRLSKISTLRLISCQMMNNSAAISRRKALRSSQCDFTI